ncbi:MAG: ATP-binding protein [Chitinophagales bacterium]
MKFQRQISARIKSKIHQGKAIVLTGPRQVGKTTLINTLLEKDENVLFLNGDDVQVRQMLEEANLQDVKRIIGKNTIVFIDEAQRINNIGLTSKLISDQLKNVQLFLSGSSSLDLNNNINEPLTGRKWEYNLYPISWSEFQEKLGYVDAISQLNHRLIYGMYPDVINNPGDEREVLQNLANSYLYKDILILANIKKPDILEKLVQALAYQLGQEVSYNELAQLLGVNKETIASYIQLLEKAFIIFRVNAFSRNLRNEIKFNKKIYFYDNGIRNAVISSFNNIELRNDKGALWENFLISERIKHLSYNKMYGSYYFWRTKQRQEIDWVEERDAKISAYEFKWNDKKKAKIPKKFIEAYNADTKIIDRSNFVEFVMNEEN